MTGYWEDAERTREAFAGSWLKTGDLGLLHDKHVYICGRSKEVIIVNGRNYYPQDIEWEASHVEGVRKGNVIAFGARDSIERDRERVVVTFEVQDAPKGLDPKELALHRQPLAALVRKAVLDGMNLSLDDVVPLGPGVLPKTSSGKLQRAKTRQQYLDGTVGTEGNRSLGSNGEKLVVAKHVAQSLLGRAQHRARRVVEHTLEIRSVADALGKVKLASTYAQKRVTRLLG
jgi:acyl-CoA synthetase (AMP-forming)/AMP-acid ligase II